MKSKTGAATALLLAVTAIIGYSALPLRNGSPSPPASEAAAGATGKDIEPALPSMKALKAPCREIEERIAEFLPENPATTENGGTSSPKIFAPEKCFEKNAASTEPKANGQAVGPSSPAGGVTTETPAEMTDTEEKGSAQIRFIIMTLPNPVHTHLSLEFDRMTEALQQAAQDQGYTYDSSWLPWEQHPRQYGDFSDEEKEEARRSFQEKQPGLLVFRKSLPSCPPQDGGRQDNQAPEQAPNCAGKPYQEGLLVFVVGENATGGIDGNQFQNAISWIQTLRPRGTGRNLRVLGPFFSGSLPSLAQLLTSGAAKEYIVKNTASISDAPKDNLSAVEVFSGDASSDLGIHWFSSFLKENNLGRFTTFQESDDLVINRYCRLLTRQGYDTGRLAIVSEDETAYGAIGPNAQVATQNSTDNPDPSLYECIQHEPDEDPRGPLNLYYPRDIAAVRSAYEKQSLLISRSSGHTGLTETLAESDSGQHDTIRTYGGDQTTLSQEASLFSLVNLLKAHHIEFIVLRSSNGLDQLFLTQFFARTYSDARVVILNSDLMFRRGSDNPGFRGTMTLSTYPLLTWQQDWTFFQKSESRHSHRTFSDASAEGIYLASRFLINLPDTELELNTTCDTLNPAIPYSDCPRQAAATPISFALLQDYGVSSSLSESPTANEREDDLAHRFSTYLQESDLYVPISPYPVLLQDYGVPSWSIENADASSPRWLTALFEGGVLPNPNLLESTISEKPGPSSSVLVQDYGLPSWLITDAAQATHPPTWLSVVGGGQVWPVAMLDEATLPESLPAEEATLPESLPAPEVEYGMAKDGQTPFGEYYVKASYVDELGRASVLSPESSIWICPAWPSWVHLECSTLRVKAPAAPPTWATKYRIYIGGTPGSETLQAEIPIRDSYIQPWALQESPEASVADRSLLSPVNTDAPPNDRNLLILPLPIRVCFSLAFMWCFWHLYCCWTGSQTASPRCRAYFAPMGDPQHNVLIFFGCFLVALAAITMATFTGAVSSSPSPFMHGGRMTLLYWGLFVLSLTALIANYRKQPSGGTTKMSKVEQEAEDNYKNKCIDEEHIISISTESKETKDGENPTEEEGVTRIQKRMRECVDKAKKWVGRSSRIHKVKVWILKNRRIQKCQNWIEDVLNRIRQHPRRWFLLAASGFFLAANGVSISIFYFEVTSQGGDWNRVFSCWRSVNLFTGVSPLMPFLLLIAGLYGWFWYTLTGLALFNCDRPILPSAQDLLPPLAMFSRERTGRKIEHLAKPLSGGYGFVLPGLFLGLVGTFFFFTQSDEFSIRSLGTKSYGRLFFVWLCVCVALIVADAFQMLRIWSRLRQLLVFLNHLPARRTLHAMRGFSWGTVWKMGGGVLEHRYKFFWRQMESFRHLRNELQRLAAADIRGEGQGASASSSEHTEHLPPLKESFYKRLDTCAASGQLFVAWYIRSYHDPCVTDLGPVRRHQDEVAKTAAAVCNSILLRKWGEESHSLIQEICGPGKEPSTSNNPEVSSAAVPEFQRLAEEFFLLPYLGFIQNILGRMRTLAIGMLWLFIAATISVASYPFDPRPVLGGMFLFVFLLVGAIIAFVYAGMHRDATLSYITNTNPGELGMDFWIKLFSLGAAPLAALLAAYFPELAGFLTSWVQPSVGNIK